VVGVSLKKKISNDQAAQITKEWDINPQCEIEIKSRQGKKATQAELAAIRKQLESLDANVKFKKDDL